MEPWTALVLAGRRGPDDPLARARGVSHRALLPVAGVPMLLRVVRALRETPEVGSLGVSIDAPERLEAVPELARLRGEGALAVHPSEATPSRSVGRALSPWPGARVLVTTADHALLTPERIAGFLAAADATDADVAVGFVERSTFEARHPGAPRTWLRLRDGAWTGANLFALRREAALRAVAFFARAERHRKTPWRLVGALGAGLLLGYATGTLGLDTAFARLSRRAGASLRPVVLDDAEAAIDVDRERDVALAEAILAARGGAHASRGRPSSGPRGTKRPLAGS